jgi:hypothetical protein
MPERPNPSSPYNGPERRVAFFPRRLRSVSFDALLIEMPNGDRRSGGDRRRHEDEDAPAKR